MKGKTNNLNQALLSAMDKYADRICLKVKRGGRYQDISFRQFQLLTLRLANFFSLRGVVTRGERVAIIADNSPEWMATYVACLLSGGIVVPLNPEFPQEVLCFALKHSGASLAVIQDGEQTRMIEDSDEAFPELRTLLVIEGDAEIQPEK